ncbi:MAG TPA: serine hydrolase [Xanthomonadales bacterium]|nr:serine hydrolase [Xanthomonadales bacterium]
MRIKGITYLVLGLALGSLLLMLAAPDNRPAGSPDPATADRERAGTERSDDSFSLLADALDPSLQMELEGIVRKQGLWPAVEKGDLALLLAIVTDPARPRMAELNGHQMMYAASLPKIAILFGAAVSIERGRLQPTQALRQDMVDMIRVSCNDCATRVLEQVGREELIELLQAPEYAFYDPNGEGGLWVGKDYAQAEAYHRDPLFGLSHGATAFQVARFYYRLKTGTLVGPESTELMLEAMSRPGIRHKFVKGLEGIPGIRMLRKSGTWKTFHADSALVQYRDQTYIMVGLANNENGGQWLAQLASPLNELVNTEGRNGRRLARLTDPAHEVTEHQGTGGAARPALPEGVGGSPVPQ